MANKKRTVKKRRTKKPKEEFGAKSKFVRDHEGMPAAELSALAKKNGLVLKPGAIYNIRANDKRKGGAPKAKAEPTPRAGKRTTAAGGDGDGLEQSFRTLVLRMGLDRAEPVWASLKAQLSGR